MFIMDIMGLCLRTHSERLSKQSEVTKRNTPSEKQENIDKHDTKRPGFHAR